MAIDLEALQARGPRISEEALESLLMRLGRRAGDERYGVVMDGLEMTDLLADFVAMRTALPELLDIAERHERLVCWLSEGECECDADVGVVCDTCAILGKDHRHEPCRHEAALADTRAVLADCQAEKPGAAEAVRLRRGIEALLESGPDCHQALYVLLRKLLDGKA